MTQTRKIAVVIPAYNEQAVIGEVLSDLVGLLFEIILVNDGSTDDTARIAEEFPIHYLEHACNLGQGAALQTGITYALENLEADVIVTFDADGQHKPAQISDLVEPILAGEFDAALGSRFLEPANVKAIPKSKIRLLKTAVFFTKLSTGLPLTDTHNGFRAFSRHAAGMIHITQNGFAHASEILAQIKKKKIHFCEIPVSVSYTDYSIHKGQPIINAVNILWDSFFGGFR
jgi:glycosyltransferase involved in cell wall biosynthesis